MELFLKNLVIKPTLRCTANCEVCSSRRELHKKLSDERMLSTQEWMGIMDQASRLGVETLDISGGEPTLYKELPLLISKAVSLGWKVNLNTNGSLINEALAESLIKAGLDSVCISIYSAVPEIHDTMRRLPGLFKKACSSVQIMYETGKRLKPSFIAGTQMLISKQNYMSFAETIKLHKDLGSQNIALAYLEGDFKHLHQMEEKDIRKFRDELVPKALKLDLGMDENLRNKYEKTLKNLFSPEMLSFKQWSEGEYNPKFAEKRCCRPDHFAIILGNGDIHACNMIEYVHEPIAGNLFKESLTEAWCSEKWNKIRKTGCKACRICPINIYNSITLRYN